MIQSAGSAKKSRPVKLETYVAKEKKKVTGGGAGASATKSLKVACERPNSIPSDIGFDAKNAAEFAGARFVKRKGDIGAKGTFRTEGKDKLKLFLVCQQGKRVKMKGKVQKGTLSAIAGSSSAGAPPAQQSASKPRIIVRYGLLRPALSPGIPFPGLDSLIDDEARTYWTPPVPVSLPAGIHWVGRVLLDSAAVPRRASPETAGDDDDDDEEFGGMTTVAPPLFPGIVGAALLERSPGVDRQIQRDADRSVGSGETKCKDKVDNDGDGKVDADDVGCQTGPGGAYDPEDTNEGDSVVTDICVPGAINVQHVEPGATSVQRHLLRIGGTIFVERAIGDVDFTSGAVDLGTDPCGPGTSVIVSWIVSGTTVVYDVAVDGIGLTKDLVVAVNTR